MYAICLFFALRNHVHISGGKPSYAGCGMHVESPEVLGNVPRDQRCQCPRDSTVRMIMPSVSHQSIHSLTTYSDLC